MCAWFVDHAPGVLEKRMQCIFCKIASKEVPADIVWEDDDVVAFHDIKALAPVHILVIPKKHFSSLNDITDNDKALMGKLMISAQKVAEKMGIAKEGYKFLIRVGQHGGQEVDHLHIHIIGGTQLFEEIHPLLQ